MFAMNVDDLGTILRIIYLSASSGAHHGKNARHITRPPHTVPLADSTASTSTATSEISHASSSGFDHESHEPLTDRLRKLEDDLVDVTRGFSTVSYVTNDVSLLFKTLQQEADNLQSVCKDIVLASSGNTTFSAVQLNVCVNRVVDVVSKLKSKIPRPAHLRVQSVSDLIDHLLNLPTYQADQGCLAFQNFEKNYESLDLTRRKCLFCFSAFPEGFVVDKTLLMYWWVGEGLIDDGDRVAEDVANDIVKQFLDFQFVQHITKNGKLVGLRMHPVIRYAVAYLAERANFFDFDFEWNPTVDFRLCQRAPLVRTPGTSEQQWIEACHSSEQQLIEAARLHPEKLRTLFFIDWPYFHVDGIGKWFRKLRNVNVFFLGGRREHDAGIHLISLKWLKGMKNLRFLGLNILDWNGEFLGDIGKLENLRILTLSGEDPVLPKKIKLLQMLTHLEISHYHHLIYPSMPKEIGELTELRVIKGFGVPAGAKLHDLDGLTKLKKLGIFAKADNFPTDEDLDALSHITSLRKLEIRWMYVGREKSRRSGRIGTLPLGLQKLSLRNFPHTEAPNWLKPSSLESLEKLYIRKGKLRDLRGNDKWKVKILRLIDLPQFDMDWSGVRHEFPDLIYLETHGCPWLERRFCRDAPEFCCHDNGVWLHKEMRTKKLWQGLGFRWSFLDTYPEHEQRRV